MQAIRWLMTAPGQPMSLGAFEPLAGPGEVVVRVAGCGVCHTDLGFYYDGVRTNRPLPLCLGHEISGRVVATGAGAERWSGTAVIVSAVIPCGNCDVCRRGRGTICAQQQMPGNDLHGGFASHVVVPARGLCAVEESRLPGAGLDLASLSVVADAVTTPYQAVVQAGVQAGDLVIVNGVGGVGGYCAQIARAHGATVVVIDVSDERLAALAGVAALTLDARTLAPKELKAAIQNFAKAQDLRAKSEWIIFECSGTKGGQETAFGLLNHGATLAVVGFTLDKVEVRLSNLMAFHARALGNWGCPPELYPAALELVLAGRVRIAPFIDKRPLAQINAVFEAVHRREVSRRVVLEPGTEEPLHGN